jgi:hypothetical protein
MPRGDKTGPAGLGPMTGRGMGYCNGYNLPGSSQFADTRFGCGFGRGCARGMGRGRGFYRQTWTTPERMLENNKISEKVLLDELKLERDEIEKAIKDIEQKNKKKKQ